MRRLISRGYYLVNLTPVNQNALAAAGQFEITSQEQCFDRAIAHGREPVRVYEVGVVPGPSPGVYAFYRGTTPQRNLYRILIPKAHSDAPAG